MAAGLMTAQTFKFLRELAKNNERQWFNVNKERYIDEVRDPLLVLVAQLGSPLAKISRHIVADPRPTSVSSRPANRSAAHGVSDDCGWFALVVVA